LKKDFGCRNGGPYGKATSIAANNNLRTDSKINKTFCQIPGGRWPARLFQQPQPTADIRRHLGCSKSGHRMAAQGTPIQRRRNLSMIAMDLKAIWEMSGKIAGCLQVVWINSTVSIRQITTSER
jgi:hypothetical protein